MGDAEENNARGRAARPERSRVHLDGRQIRALAHPLRARLLGALRLDGPATATALAQTLGTNTGATSYHLRQLADVGLVVEEAERGTARQRWWRSAHEVSSWRATDFDDDPDASAASDWFQSYQVSRTAEESERWIAAQRDWPTAWRHAAGFNDSLLRLSPGQLEALNQEIWAVIRRYDREPPVTGDAEQVREVLIFYSGFPRLPEAADATHDPAHATEAAHGPAQAREEAAHGPGEAQDAGHGPGDAEDPGHGPAGGGEPR